jgi:hypothetical protein
MMASSGNEPAPLSEGMVVRQYVRAPDDLVLHIRLCRACHSSLGTHIAITVARPTHPRASSAMMRSPGVPHVPRCEQETANGKPIE